MTWYEITGKKEVSEVWLYDEIGAWGIGAKEFIAELNAIKSPKIDLHINSPGGGVFDGAAIFNAIKRHPAEVTSYIDGIAASIASVVALAGDPVYMAENALWMMHNPFGLVMGNAEDMRKTADLLEKIRDTMVGAYVGKSGKTEDDVKTLLDAETWFNANEAKEVGFIDEVTEKMDLAACAQFVPVMNKLGYKHIPRILNARKEMPSQRDLERILRDAGCSREQAKSILARGYRTDLRDEDSTATDPPAKPTLRDADPVKPAKKDKFTELFIRAEMNYPSQS